MRQYNLSSLLFIVLSFITIPALAQETKIPQSKVPVPVMAAFHSSYPKAIIRGTNKEMKAGTAFYEIESRDGAMKRDLLYAANGSVTEIEEIIPQAQLPQAVQTALSTNYKTAKVKSVEKNIQGSVVHYEILLHQKGKKNFEVIFNEDGTVVPK